MSVLDKTSTEYLRKIAAQNEKKIEKVKPKRKPPAAAWKPGQSGNPNGRPKGSRNKVTVLKEAVLANAENIVLENLEEIVKTTVELAKAGDPTCLSIIWKNVMPQPDKKASSKEDRLNIHINIEGMEKPTVDIEQPIDGEFKEIDD